MAQGSDSGIFIDVDKIIGLAFRPQTYNYASVTVIKNIEFCDFDGFVRNLENGKDPSVAMLYEGEYISAFEFALGRPVSSQFIKECLEWGCNPYHINPHTGKTATHFAVESLDIENLSCLLLIKAINVNSKYEGKTPLNYLTSMFISDEITLILNLTCITALLNYGASPNICADNDDGIPPIRHVLKFGNKINYYLSEEIKTGLRKGTRILLKSCIEEFLKCNYLVLEDEDRRLFREEFPELELPAEGEYTEYQLKFPNFFNEYVEGDFEDYYLKQLHAFFLQPSSPDLSSDELKKMNTETISKCILLCQKKLFNALRQIPFDINVRGELKVLISPLETAFALKDNYAFKELIVHKDLTPETVNELILYILRSNSSKLALQPVKVSKEDLELFITLIFSSHSDKIDVNYKNNDGDSLLYLADSGDITDIYIEKFKRSLLERGACLAIRNKGSQPCLQNTSVEWLETHLDNCITTNNEHSNNSKYEIYLDYKNFIYPTSSESSEPTKSPESTNIYDNLQRQLGAIYFFAESKKYERLLQHPLLKSFVLLKWLQISKLFYLNFGCYIFFMVSLCLHAFSKFGIQNAAAGMWFAVLTCIGLFYLIAREIFQICVSPKVYFRSIVNYMELFLILSAMCSLFWSWAAVIAILLATWELSLLIGSLPHLFVSTLILMWQTVLTTFFKSLLVFSIFLLQFGLCFYLLNEKSQVAENAGSKNVQEDEKSGEYFNKFSNFYATGLNIFGMLIGEIEASSMPRDSFLSFLVLLLFVLLMTIVLSNLLNALAISDTQTIKAEAEEYGAKMRVKLLLHYVRTLNSKIFNYKWSQELLGLLIDLNSEFSRCDKIAISPNENNKVEIISKRETETKQMNADPASTPLRDNLESAERGSLASNNDEILSKINLLDSETIKSVFAVIERNSRNSELEKSQQSAESHLKKSEEKSERYQKDIERKFASMEEKYESTQKDIERKISSVFESNKCQCVMMIRSDVEGIQSSQKNIEEKLCSLLEIVQKSNSK